MAKVTDCPRSVEASNAGSADGVAALRFCRGGPAAGRCRAIRRTARLRRQRRRELLEARLPSDGGVGAGLR